MPYEVRNCQRCGKVFMSTGSLICDECLKKEEEQYEQVKRYLEMHLRADVRETSEATGVPSEIVMEFIRKGLLILSHAQDKVLRCAICGRPISSGRLCPKCEAALLEAAGHPAKTSEDDKSGTRMYSIYKDAKKRY